MTSSISNSITFPHKDLFSSLPWGMVDFLGSPGYLTKYPAVTQHSSDPLDLSDSLSVANNRFRFWSRN